MSAVVVAMLSIIVNGCSPDRSSGVIDEAVRQTQKAVDVLSPEPGWIAIVSWEDYRDEGDFHGYQVRCEPTPMVGLATEDYPGHDAARACAWLNTNLPDLTDHWTPCDDDLVWELRIVTGTDNRTMRLSGVDFPDQRVGACTDSVATMANDALWNQPSLESAPSATVK